MEELALRFHEILGRIRRAAPEGRAVPQLLAVSKGHPAEAIEALYRLGHRDFGENYVQELIGKSRELDARGCVGIRWHFIGHLQTNKVKALLEVVHAIHTIDSEKLAREVAKRWKQSGRPGRIPVFIEVNVDGEASKAGLDPEAAVSLSAKISGEMAGELELLGLMCIPAQGTTQSVRAAFRSLRDLEFRCRPHTVGGLSMGMSGDLELAVGEGSTHVRVGTALFGERRRAGA